EQIGMMEMVLNVDALADAVRKMREANSKYPL
ncbi:MAG: glycine/sarcosine/betaine reductase complex selenoprotein A, partial [Bilophila wadsworthia]